MDKKIGKDGKPIVVTDNTDLETTDVNNVVNNHADVQSAIEQDPNITNEQKADMKQQNEDELNSKVDPKGAVKELDENKTAANGNVDEAINIKGNQDIKKHTDIENENEQNRFNKTLEDAGKHEIVEANTILNSDVATVGEKAVATSLATANKRYESVNTALKMTQRTILEMSKTVGNTNLNKEYLTNLHQRLASLTAKKIEYGKNLKKAKDEFNTITAPSREKIEDYTKLEQAGHYKELAGNAKALYEADVAKATGNQDYKMKDTKLATALDNGDTEKALEILNGYSEKTRNKKEIKTLIADVTVLDNKRKISENKDIKKGLDSLYAYEGTKGSKINKEELRTMLKTGDLDGARAELKKEFPGSMPANVQNLYDSIGSNTVSGDTLQDVEKIDSTNEDLVKLINKKEDFSPKAYWDVNSYSIGYGTKIVNGKPVTKDMVITEEEAAKARDEFVKTYSSQIKRKLKGVKLTQKQFNALVDFSYNVGIGNFNKSTLLKKLKAGDMKGAAEEFKTWKYKTVDGKPVADAGLSARRKTEEDLFRTGLQKTDSTEDKVVSPTETKTSLKSITNKYKGKTDIKSINSELEEKYKYAKSLSIGKSGYTQYGSGKSGYRVLKTELKHVNKIKESIPGAVVTSSYRDMENNYTSRKGFTLQNSAYSIADTYSAGATAGMLLNRFADKGTASTDKAYNKVMNFKTKKELVDYLTYFRANAPKKKGGKVIVTDDMWNKIQEAKKLPLNEQKKAIRSIGRLDMLNNAGNGDHLNGKVVDLRKSSTNKKELLKKFPYKIINLFKEEKAWHVSYDPDSKNDGKIHGKQ